MSKATHNSLTLIQLLVCAAIVVAPTASYSQDAQNVRGLRLAQDESAVETLGYAEKYALLIGVNDYENQDIRNLRYAVSDAVSIADLLVEEYGYRRENITVLTNEYATRSRVLSELQFYVENDSVSENSQLLFYFAGHGQTVANQIGYVLPYDADKTQLAATGIRMGILKDLAVALRPKHVLFLMDACYGGLSATRSIGRSQVSLRNILSAKGRHIITAGSADEEVVEADTYLHSAFTYALLNALKYDTADSNDDGFITVMELATKLQDDVAFYADQVGGKQTPQFGEFDRAPGQFVFIRDESLLANIAEADEVLLNNQRENIAELFRKKVTVTSNVDNALVFIDGAEYGFTSNLTLETGLSIGLHNIELRKNRYDDVSREIIVSPEDSALVVELTMSPNFAHAEFTVNPNDAVVSIDDQYAGTGSFSIDIEKGIKQIEVARDGYITENRTETVTQDTVDIRISLEKISGLLDLETIPRGALVIDNLTDTLGYSPIRAYLLSFGKHALSLRYEDYQDQSLVIDVQSAETTRRTVEMRLLPEVVARKTYRRMIRGRVTKFLIFTGLSGGAYYGSTLLADEVDKLPEDDKNRTTYQGGRWAAVGLSGIFAFTSLSNLLGIFTTRYDAILEDELRKEARLSHLHIDAGLIPLGNRMGLRVSVTF